MPSVGVTFLREILGLRKTEKKMEHVSQIEFREFCCSPINRMLMSIIELPASCP
jgi:hypothetical protein